MMSQVIPNLAGRRPIVIALSVRAVFVLDPLWIPQLVFVLIAISLAASVLDHALGGFGGGYALISLAMLYFQMRVPPESRT